MSKVSEFGFKEILTLIFVIAKLTGYFPYSWAWVFSPMLLFSIIVVLRIILEGINKGIEDWRVEKSGENEK